ncbi:polar amino acid transport system substrate-binding protein [Arthrobacter stackebrandtii]|uniref:Polar amino acid transport system substrate-binding protein n=1 Tax=Arthrobacter stackebrandtii TaxID=272161 RepID=A0ABS4YWN6_9MICC|nr:ABC transporter substrate-binding protein [Arthrobacter stackebrandtii]MBP2413129.1 polar amino acid transport system substrate-binding protein [Arthrobacter stackebrandtii]PYH01104.1 ABC transporter substrate-binding protein [Arthrobacter stackebrandtii]
MHISSKLGLRFAAVLAVAALALTGCNNAEQTPGGSSGAPTFDPSTVKPDESLIALLPAALKDKKTLTVGSDTSYEPAEFLAADGQTPVGYDVDLAHAIGAVLGKEVKVQTSEFSTILPSLGSKYDLGISSFTINPERSKAVNFVSYFNAGVWWAVQKGNPKNFSLDDICGKKVGVQTGTVEEDPDVKDRSAKCVADGKPAIEVISLKNQTDVTTRLVNGSIDAMSADSPIIKNALQKTGDSLETLGDVYDSAEQGIAIAKSDTAFAEVIEKVMNKLMADGVYTQILKDWNNDEGAITKAVLNPTAG